MEKEFLLLVTGFGLGIVAAASMFVTAWRRTKTRRTPPAPPPPPPQEYKIIVTCLLEQPGAENYLQGQYLDLPIEWKRMVMLSKTIFARGYVFNHGLTSREAGNPLTRGEYEVLRELFLSRNLIREKTPGVQRSGFVFTNPGKAFIRMWADLPPYSRDELKAYIQEQQLTQVHTEERQRVQRDLSDDAS